MIFSTETQYQYARVLQFHDGVRWLQLNEGVAVHSLYRPWSYLTGGYWDDFLVLPLAGERGVPAPDRDPRGRGGDRRARVRPLLPVDARRRGRARRRADDDRQALLRPARAAPAPVHGRRPAVARREPRPLRRDLPRRLPPAVHPVLPRHQGVLRVRARAPAPGRRGDRQRRARARVRCARAGRLGDAARGVPGRDARPRVSDANSLVIASAGPLSGQRIVSRQLGRCLGRPGRSRRRGRRAARARAARGDRLHRRPRAGRVAHRPVDPPLRGRDRGERARSPPARLRGAARAGRRRRARRPLGARRAARARGVRARPHPRRGVRRSRHRAGRRRAGGAAWPAPASRRPAMFEASDAARPGVARRSAGRRLRRRELDGGGAGVVAAALLRASRTCGCSTAGLAAWVAAGYPVSTRRPLVRAGDFVRSPGGMPLIDAAAPPIARRARRAARRARARALPGRARAGRPGGGAYPGCASTLPSEFGTSSSEGGFLEAVALRSSGFAAFGVGDWRRGRRLLRLGGDRGARGAGARAGRLPRRPLRRLVERLDHRPDRGRWRRGE